MNHVMIDAYLGDVERLNDLKAVHSVLERIVDELNLDSVMPPFVLPYYYAKEKDDDGISAFVFLLGGHITIHTFPLRRCLFLDVLYDGYYNIDNLIDIIKKMFLTENVQTLRTERRFIDTSIDEEKIFTPSLEKLDFGPHTIAKIENVDISLEQIYDWLDELPEKINMEKISRPYVIKSSVNNPQYISGLVLIAQSHIAFHYSIDEKILYCDAFSCSFYKIDNFEKYLKNKVAKNFIIMTLIRGSKHQRQISQRETRNKLLARWKENIK